MKNVYKEVKEDTGSSQYRRRHEYLHSNIAVDGVNYKIISVMPKSDVDYNPKKVSELLAYLINGK
ncbi:MAG: hypothetical protein NC548_65140 [Lachnospiraceae bacterium]|nr:hypothetical protein [Lachnospiraceae bacterium]MCM1227600.1 hypothetical protein [Clostridium sp.]